MGIVSSLASVHKIPGDLAKSVIKAVKSTGTALQTLSTLAHNIGNLEAIVPKIRSVKADLYMITAPGVYARKVVNLLFESQARRIANPFIMEKIFQDVHIRIPRKNAYVMACHLTVNTAPDFSARSVANSLFESQIRREANPFLMALISREATLPPFNFIASVLSYMGKPVVDFFGTH